jgi:hypothetical protein
MRNSLFKATLGIIFCGLLSIPTTTYAAQVQLAERLSGGGNVTLSFATAPLLTMTEIPFTVELTGDTGVVFSDASVRLQLTMPAMPMPPNNPKALWQDDAYHGTAIFTMAGVWEAKMLIQRPGHDLDELTFNLGEIKMK